VLFIDASHDYQQGSNQNYLGDDDRVEILRTYHQRENIAKYAYLATREEIAANDYNLNIPRYLDTFEQEEQIDLAAVNASIVALRTQLSELEGQMQTYLKELGLDG